MAGFWSYHEWGGWPDVHWVLVLAQNTKAGMDAQGPWVMLLATSTEAGMDAWGCVTMVCDKGMWQECVTGLGVGQSFLKCAWQDLEPGVVRVCDWTWNWPEFVKWFGVWKLNIGVWKPKIGSCQHWFRVFVSVGHKHVTGHNKSHPLTSTWSSLELLHQPLLGLHWPHWSVPITPN